MVVFYTKEVSIVVSFRAAPQRRAVRPQATAAIQTKQVLCTAIVPAKSGASCPIRTSAQVAVSGSFWASYRTAVVFLHQYGARKLDHGPIHRAVVMVALIYSFATAPHPCRAHALQDRGP